jgi:hypothetical protein
MIQIRLNKDIIRIKNANRSNCLLVILLPFYCIGICRHIYFDEAENLIGGQSVRRQGLARFNSRVFPMCVKVDIQIPRS